MSDTATAAPVDPEDIRKAAASAVAPDAITAQLLAKHAAGEKLSPQENGKIGALVKQQKRAGLFSFLGRKSDAPGQPALAGPGQPAGVATVAPAGASSVGLPVVPADVELVQRTTAAVLKSADAIARRYVAREARKAGATDKTLSDFDRAAALPAATQDLMVQTSPDVLAALGLDPRHYPLTVFVGALGLWGTNLWLCVDELKGLQKDQARERADRLQAQIEDDRKKRQAQAPVTQPGATPFEQGS